ncbi:MAG: CDP-2,3-bis-(O-geranylgeranyl)-sn-glycerol synthase [Candidatus Micrarchaeota archaeon]
MAFDILQLILFILPAYIANAVPVLLGGGTYLDLGKNWNDGGRIFGDGKTIRGFIAGVVAGFLAGIVLAFFAPSVFFASMRNQILGAFALSFGTMFGDAAGSFVKRRMKIEPGKPFILDQLSFLAFALVFVAPLSLPYLFEPVSIGFLFVLTYVLHIGTNTLANKLGLKKVPW